MGREIGLTNDQLIIGIIPNILPNSKPPSSILAAFFEDKLVDCNFD